MFIFYFILPFIHSSFISPPSNENYLCLYHSLTNCHKHSNTKRKTHLPPLSVPCKNKKKPISRSSMNPSWLEDEESVASSSYTKKLPFPQKPMQAAPQQQPMPQTQSQHSPGSNELKLNAQQASDDKSLFDNDGGNMENETKSVSSLRSQDR